ncbi:MAG: hypothetical protein M3137_17605, partial [Actinomycetota bacterium]|nr:hypothetical protein [Actinomycetota bacterium]
MRWLSIRPGEVRNVGRASLAAALALGVLAVAFGTGYTSTRSLTNDASVWLRKGDTIAQINAPSRRFQASVDDRNGERSLAAPGDPLEVVQEPDGTVYVAIPGKDQVFKVDLSTMEPGPATAGNSVLAGDGGAYAVDSGKGTVTPLDPRTALPSAAPVRVGTPIQSQALDGSTVYVAGQDGSVTAISDGGRKVKRTQVAGKGARLSMAVAGPAATVVDSGAGTVRVLGGRAPTRTIRLPGTSGAPVQVAPNQPGPDVWLVRDHQLVDVRLADGDTSSVALAGADTYEPPVVFGAQVYVPDLSTHSVDVYDTASLRLIHTYAVPPGAPGDPGGIEVVAKAGQVWVDDPSSRDALALSAGGSQSRTVDKGTGFDVVDPNAKPAPPPGPGTPAPASPAPVTASPAPGPAATVPV